MSTETLDKMKTNNDQPPSEILEEVAKSQNQPVVIRFMVLRPPVTLMDVLPFIAVFSVYCLVVHTILMVIKKVHRGFYNGLVMFFIIIFPPITMMILRDYFFITLWLGLMGFFGYCVRIGFSRGLLARENPKRIYKMFKRIFTVTNGMILLGQMMVLLSKVFLLPTMRMSIRCLIYSVYFAVFCREVMFNLSRIMATTTGFYSKDDRIMPAVPEDTTKCMICCENLMNKKKIYTNSCGHSFHMECIKGWALLANNFFCIYCKKPIEDTNKLTKDLWYKAECMMRPLMNFLRSSISFFVVIYVFMVFRLK